MLHAAGWAGRLIVNSFVFFVPFLFVLHSIFRPCVVTWLYRCVLRPLPLSSPCTNWEEPVVLTSILLT